MHLRGHHTHLIGLWSRSPAIEAAQLNEAAASDFWHYHSRLREDPLIYLSPVDRAEIPAILEKTGGH